MNKKSPNTRNITVTNPEIITMLQQLCDELEGVFGFRPNNTQALMYLLINRNKK